MRHYIIDAHNLIHKDTNLRAVIRKSVENARSSIVKYIQAFSGKFPSYRFTLVFDGKPTSMPPMNKLFTVIFSGENIAADTIIKSHIDKESGSALTHVVSSDHEVFSYARINSCTPIKSEDFLVEIKNALQPKQSGPKGKSGTRGEKPSRASKKEIDEMKKLFGLE